LSATVATYIHSQVHMNLLKSFGAVVSFFFQAEDGIRDGHVTGVQTCALPISAPLAREVSSGASDPMAISTEPFEKQFRDFGEARSEEHTSELQSRGHLVCRLLLEKKTSRGRARHVRSGARRQHGESHDTGHDQ